MPRFLVHFAIILLSLSLSSANAGQLYSITSVDIPGAVSSEAYDINDHGQVVGVFQTESGANRAFLWHQSNGVLNLGVLEGYGHSIARAINDAGQITGDCGTTFYSAAPQAFIYDTIHGMRAVSGLGREPSAWAINNSGVIAGEFTTDEGEYHAFTWSESEGMRDIVNDMFGTGQSSVLGINDSNQCALYRHIVHSGNLAFRTAFIWDSSNGALPLGDLGGHSYGWGINNLGQLVGIAQDEEGTLRAFLWDSSSGMVQIGTGETQSAAYDINEKGLIVGEADGATLWKDGNQYRLNDLIPAASGWNLLSARAVNNHGQIVGWGTLDGQTKAFLLTPVATTGSAINLLLLN